ncbi:unnamed protein product [Prorocentrum cordatum]|uniref:Uncharacterized protein n=1 Tax=Prorocentrum cordatum TaxID=2364126 RepID=A0ABN9WR72_9DINO|nr:unnamed protein product [Polarella glacialis]
MAPGPPGRLVLRVLLSGAALEGLPRRWLAAATVGTTSCEGPVQPLLWRATKSEPTPWTAYILGSYPLPAEAAHSLVAPVPQALSCADVAFFRLACSLGSSSVGHFMDHCGWYSYSEAEGSISGRVGAGQAASLQTAARQLLSEAPQECSGSGLQAAAQKSASELTNVAVRTTLKAFYRQALRAVNPSQCAMASGGQSYESYLRAEFGDQRPTLGLVDVEEECLLTQPARPAGDGLRQDKELAAQMVANFSNASWYAHRKAVQRALIQAYQCGNVATIKTLMEQTGYLEDLEEMPWNKRAKLNPSIADAVNRARSRYPGKTVVLVVDVLHMVDSGSEGGAGVPSILQEDGYTVERIKADQDLGCSASTFKAAGAEQRKECLMPPWQEQNESCVSFNEAFSQRLDGDPLYGRVKDSAQCKACQESDEACTCQVSWQNDTAFTKLCRSTVVNDASGQVLVVDLIRNPGSTQEGPREAEKNVKALFQHCVSTSCKVDLMQLMEQRKWYTNDSHLHQGLVEYRCSGGPGSCPFEGGGPNGDAEEPWYSDDADDGGGGPAGQNASENSTEAPGAPVQGGEAPWLWIVLAVAAVGASAVAGMLLWFLRRGGRRRRQGRKPGGYEEAGTGTGFLESGSHAPGAERQLPGYAHLQDVTELNRAAAAHRSAARKLEGYDTSILDTGLQMQQALGAEGARALQTLHAGHGHGHGHDSAAAPHGQTQIHQHCPSGAPSVHSAGHPPHYPGGHGLGGAPSAHGAAGLGGCAVPQGHPTQQWLPPQAPCHGSPSGHGSGLASPPPGFAY